MTDNTVLIIQLLSSTSMLAILFLVQALVYPQFLEIPSDLLKQYSQKHQSRISIVVVPLMLIELFSLLLLLFQNKVVSIWLYMATLCLSLIWALTFFLIVPVHQRIERFAQQKDIFRLIKLNSLRTLFWFFKFICIIILFYDLS